MKVIITGATGMIGQGVLLECLDHEAVDEVLAIVRNPLHIVDQKLKVQLHEDFLNFSTISHLLEGYDACFYCLGISAAGLREEAYMQITHNFTMALANILHRKNPGMTFIYVSGMGTDSSEKKNIMWARIKGKTENNLLKLGFRQAFMFRPGLIIPEKGITSRTKSYRLFYQYFMWLVKGVKKVASGHVVTTSQIGKAMINVTLYGYAKSILKPKDILTLAESDPVDV